MTTNMNNTAVTNTDTMENKVFLIPDMADDMFSEEDLMEDCVGIQPTFRRVTIPSGGQLQFELPSDDPQNPDYTKTLTGVILFNHPACAYWPGGKKEDEDTSPICSSNDGIQGYGTPGGSCAVCPFNQYNTGIDSKGNPTKGKACKNMRNIYILRQGEYIPILLSLAPTSLRPFKDFINISFVNRRRPTWASVVEIGLTRVVSGGNPYSVATFRKVADLAGDELLEMKTIANGFRNQIRQALAQPPAMADDVVEVEEPASFGTTAPSYRMEGQNGQPGSVSVPVIDGDREDLPL